MPQPSEHEDERALYAPSGTPYVFDEGVRRVEGPPPWGHRTENDDS